VNGISEDRDGVEKEGREERGRRKGGEEVGELEFLPLPHHATVVSPNPSLSLRRLNTKSRTHP